MAGFTIATSRSVGAYEPDDRCYRHPRTCAAAPRSIVLRSTNGDVWSELDLRAVPGLERVDDVVSHPSGRMVLFGQEKGGSWSAWTWLGAGE
jgi:hypothetical protein